MRFFSTDNRPVHMGPYPTERLARLNEVPSFAHVPASKQLNFERTDDPHSIINAMREHQAMLDAIRDGLINKAVAQVPDDPIERAQHLKSFGYFADAAVVGVCALPSQAILKHPHINPDIANLNHKLQTGQTKTLAAGIDMVMADLRDSIEADPTSIEHHTHALVLLYENPRDPKTDETGTGWIKDAQAHRAGLLAAETASVLANYLRLFGHDARGHTSYKFRCRFE